MVRFASGGPVSGCIALEGRSTNLLHEPPSKQPSTNRNPSWNFSRPIFHKANSIRRRHGIPTPNSLGGATDVHQYTIYNLQHLRYVPNPEEGRHPHLRSVPPSSAAGKGGARSQTMIMVSSDQPAKRSHHQFCPATLLGDGHRSYWSSGDPRGEHHPTGGNWSSHVARSHCERRWGQVL